MSLDIARLRKYSVYLYNHNDYKLYLGLYKNSGIKILFESYIITKQWEFKCGTNIFLIKVNNNTHCIDLNIIPLAQQHEIAKYHQKYDREKRLLARTFLFEYCQLHFQLDQFEFTFNQYLQPSFEVGEVEFSLSYSEKYILVGISKSRSIGVDIEYRKKDLDIDGIASLIMHPDEMVYFLGLKDRHDKLKFFYKLWSGKESLIKVFGTGLHYPIKDINLMQEQLFFYEDDGKTYEYKQMNCINDYAISCALEVIK